MMFYYHTKIAYLVRTIYWMLGKTRDILVLVLIPTIKSLKDTNTEVDESFCCSIQHTFNFISLLVPCKKF